MRDSATPKLSLGEREKVPRLIIWNTSKAARIPRTVIPSSFEKLQEGGHKECGLNLGNQRTNKEQTTAKNARYQAM